MEPMPAHMRLLAVVLIVIAAVILLVSLSALFPRGVEAPGPGPSSLPNTSAAGSTAPSASA